LVTDSVIRSMDFRSLPYLINEAPVLYKLSGTDYIHETKLTQSGNGRLLGVAPTIENKPLLPFASSLLMQIADEYKCDVFKEGQATSTNFIKNAGQYSYIHLATHADTSMRPHLYFSESREHTHSLPLDSIYFLPLKAELSVLAACNTSSGSYEYGEGTLSFARAFLTSGCKSSISTIWSVDDKTTSEVLSEFYSGLNDHLEKDEALRNAQLKYLKRCKSSREASPFYWSGIILTGDHRPVELEKKNRMALWVPSGLLLLFFVFIYCRKK
ncbi:MAG TPA: CHAT domain-containing protein, partial [Bacteroidia bacterium]|nr:CHAT domain-containing protein [Bacteroidia bacterium]